MLSDFDLAKQSNEPAGLPGMVHSEQNGVRWSNVPRDGMRIRTLTQFTDSYRSSIL